MKAKMSKEVDLTGVHPVKRAETLRRIEVVKAFISLSRPTKAEGERHAKSLGIGYNQFLVLVRAWMEHGRASAMPGAKKRMRLFHEHQLRRLDPAIEEIIADVIEEKGAFGRLTVILDAVRHRCEEAGLKPPTMQGLRPRLDEARRRAPSSDLDGRAVLIGRALTDVPVLHNDGVMEPALLVLSIQASTRRVLAYGVGSPSRPPEVAAVLMETVKYPVVAVQRDIRVSLPPGFERDRLMVAARAAGLDGVTWLSGTPAPHDSVYAVLGGRLGDVRVGEFQQRRNWKLQPVLNARTASPLSEGEVEAVIAAAVAEHNASHPPLDAEPVPAAPGDVNMIERLRDAFEATATRS
ncbi:hypothetical protein [Sphingomonas faeni]|uniref:hypothetical protein n=1 Tax=Sphingomonas faeni TaxID=185950 RepID=UPI0027D91765|nr:hypothetical protein [Sphingomonas faeni]